MNTPEIMCIHLIAKTDCRICKNKCIHNKRKSQCKDCNGSQICIHNKRKSQCNDCDGSQLCKSSFCETSRNKKYNGYCSRCYIHLFPK